MSREIKKMSFATGQSKDYLVCMQQGLCCGCVEHNHAQAHYGEPVLLHFPKDFTQDMAPDSRLEETQSDK